MLEKYFYFYFFVCGIDDTYGRSVFHKAMDIF